MIGWAEPVEVTTMSAATRWSSSRSNGTASPPNRAASAAALRGVAVADEQVPRLQADEALEHERRHLAGADAEHRLVVEVSKIRLA